MSIVGIHCDVAIIREPVIPNRERVIFYYDRSRRRLELFLDKQTGLDLSRISEHGVDLDTLESGGQRLSDEGVRLVNALRDRGMLADWAFIPQSWPTALQHLDRQLRFFSQIYRERTPQMHQESISKARLCIVGLGGAGSNLVVQLATVGFQHFLLIDNDAVQASNLNRQPFFRASHVGRSKVSVVSEWLAQFAPQSVTDGIEASIFDTVSSTAIREFRPTLVVNCADAPSIIATTESIQHNQTHKTPVLVGSGYYLEKIFAGPLLINYPSAFTNFPASVPDLTGANIPGFGGNIFYGVSIGSAIAAKAVIDFVLRGHTDHFLLNRQVWIDVINLTTEFLNF